MSILDHIIDFVFTVFDNSRIRRKTRRLEKALGSHAWTEWKIAISVQKSMFGETESMVNELACSFCGITQHASLEEPTALCTKDPLD